MRKYEILKPCREFIQYRFFNINGDEELLDVSKGNYGIGFADDRDYIMQSVAFRRLSSKTQIFYSQAKDDLRTRLTHTLEVAQIARKISRAVGLDEDLTEAIALGHDVGHTPFGHVGERTLNKFSQGDDKRQKADKECISQAGKGFKHNLQSVRALVDYSGDLKFSNYMLYGVREHSKQYWKSPEDVGFYNRYESFCSYDRKGVLYPAWSFEAYIVKWADEIAQRHHDLEDAYHQKIMTAEEIVDILYPLSTINESDIIKAKYERLVESAKTQNEAEIAGVHYFFINAITEFTIDAYVTVLTDAICSVLDIFCKSNHIYSAEEFKSNYLSIDPDDIRRKCKFEGTRIHEIDCKLGEALKYNILDSYSVQKMDGKGAYVVRKLVRAYLSNPQQLPDECINRLVKLEIFDRMSDDVQDKHLKQTLLAERSNYDMASVQKWKNYECREALRIFVENSKCRSIIYEKLLRIVIDYIAGMTDRFAMSRYRELY